jgi:hypothetical protein
MTIITALILAAVWGVVWAVALESKPGRFLAARYTWLTVVIGVGVDLLIGLLVMPIEVWMAMAAILALSSIGIVARSLWNEHQDQRTLHTMIHGDQDTHRQ